MSSKARAMHPIPRPLDAFLGGVDSETLAAISGETLVTAVGPPSAPTILEAEDQGVTGTTVLFTPAASTLPVTYHFLIDSDPEWPVSIVPQGANLRAHFSAQHAQEIVEVRGVSVAGAGAWSNGFLVVLT